MADLILTEAEKQAGSYLEWDDASLGRLVKKAALVIGDRKGEESSITYAAGLLLIGAAVDVGAERSVLEFSGVTAPKPVGDWVITVQRKESDK